MTCSTEEAKGFQNVNIAQILTIHIFSSIFTTSNLHWIKYFSYQEYLGNIYEIFW